MAAPQCFLIPGFYPGPLSHPLENNMAAAGNITVKLVPEARQVHILRHILDIRERELLEVKGPCRNKRCKLHYAHSGPCDEPQ